MGLYTFRRVRTKPLVGFAMGFSMKQGGWGQGWCSKGLGSFSTSFLMEMTLTLKKNVETEQHGHLGYRTRSHSRTHTASHFVPSLLGWWLAAIFSASMIVRRADDSLSWRKCFASSSSGDATSTHAQAWGQLGARIAERLAFSRKVFHLESIPLVRFSFS